MKRIAALLLACCAARGAAALELEELLRALAAQSEAHGRYTELQYLRVLDKPLRSAGELYYRAPDHLEKRSLEPRVETLSYANGIAWVERGTRRLRLDTGRYPQILPFVESIRATLAGDRAALERHFEVQLAGELSQWNLLLTPRDAQVRKVVQSIHVEGSGATVRSLQVTRDNGDRSVMSIEPLPP